MIRKNIFQIISSLLVASMLLSGCGAAAATASDSVSAPEATAEETADAVITAADAGSTAASTDTTIKPSEPDLSSMSGQEIYDHLYGGLTDLYAMETYDDVPEYLSEWHDDVDYGTIEEDVFGGRYDSHVHDHSILQTLYGNMLSEGLTVPMIIVGADMYTDLLSEKDDKSDAELRPCYDKGVEDIAQDLMPFIESRSPVKTGRMNTAVTGASRIISGRAGFSFTQHSHPISKTRILSRRS